MAKEVQKSERPAELSEKDKIALARELKPNRHGMVPVVINVSEGGMGLRRGEVRGVSPEVAAVMIQRKTAFLYSEKHLAAAQAEAAKQVAASDKDMGQSGLPAGF